MSDDKLTRKYVYNIFYKNDVDDNIKEDNKKKEYINCILDNIKKNYKKIDKDDKIIIRNI
jgi:hypothetical protein